MLELLPCRLVSRASPSAARRVPGVVGGIESKHTPNHVNGNRVYDARRRTSRLTTGKRSTHEYEGISRDRGHGPSRSVGLWRRRQRQRHLVDDRDLHVVDDLGRRGFVQRNGRDVVLGVRHAHAPGRRQRELQRRVGRLDVDHDHDDHDALIGR